MLQTPIKVTAAETLAIRHERDVIMLTTLLRQQASEIGMNTLKRTKFSTAASELARNMLLHGGGGNARLERIHQETKVGIRLIVSDKGPGIADVGRAMQDGYSTGGGMGLGLPGAKRLSDEFHIVSEPGEGTTVTIISWAND